MVTYEKLHDHPTIAPSLIGMSLSAFDQLSAEFEVAHAERLNASRVTRRKRQTRVNERWGLGWFVGIGMICGNACS